jgi:hypothetical protein
MDDLHLLRGVHLVSRWVIRARVWGGVTGSRESLLKSNGVVVHFATEQEARVEARRLTTTMNGPYAKASFAYSAELDPTYPTCACGQDCAVIDGVFQPTCEDCGAVLTHGIETRDGAEAFLNSDAVRELLLREEHESHDDRSCNPQCPFCR